MPTLLVARTDADSAKLLTSDVDERDRPFLTGERTPEGFFRLNGGLDAAIARGLAYAPYADLIWCETSTPDLVEAKRFAEAIHAKFPGKLLAYNCSPSFNWKKKLDDATIARFQRELGAMGYKFQFVTLAGFHALNHGMFELARAYRDEGMTAYSRLQQAEFASEAHGYTATRHQREVGTGYFDDVAKVIAAGQASTHGARGLDRERAVLGFSAPEAVRWMTATALHRSPGVGCPLDGTRRYVQSSAPARHPLEGARGRTFSSDRPPRPQRARPALRRGRREFSRVAGRPQGFPLPAGRGTG